MDKWMTFETDRGALVTIRADAIEAVEERGEDACSILVGGRWIWLQSDRDAVLERLGA